MWLFSNKAKLLRLLDRLAFYNDRGITYARHDPDQVATQRAAGLEQVRALVAAIGPARFPQAFLEGTGSGDVASDGEGLYLQLLKAHFRKRPAA